VTKGTGNGSSKSDNSDSADEHEICSEPVGPAARLERSLSTPTKSTSITLERDLLKVRPVSDGEDKDPMFNTLKGSSASSGPSSQSSDSGFSQGSQDLLSPVETDCIQAADSKASDESCDSDACDSACDEAGATKLAQQKRPQSLNLDSSRKRKMSTEETIFLSKRRDELPSTVFPQKNVLKATSSVLLTPDTDVNTPSTSSSTPTPPSFICTMCCVRPKDACFIHGQISHQVCCYPCAKMIFKNKGTCPVCRRRIEKITKNIVV
jgi:Zinc finger, C3HC4 type (RING finger)